LLIEKNHKISEVCRDITRTLCPFEIEEDETGEIEEKLEKLDTVARKLTATVSRFSRDLKAKKFKKHPKILEETAISSSQFSIFQSKSQSQGVGDESFETEDQELDFDEATPENNRTPKYSKKPLNSNISQQTRRKRVHDKKLKVKVWAQEEGVSASQLLGNQLP
jgi:DNA repair ATPase RecN